MFVVVGGHATHNTPHPYPTRHSGGVAFVSFGVAFLTTAVRTIIVPFGSAPPPPGLRKHRCSRGVFHRRVSPATEASTSPATAPSARHSPVSPPRPTKAIIPAIAEVKA